MLPPKARDPRWEIERAADGKDCRDPEIVTPSLKEPSSTNKRPGSTAPRPPLENPFSPARRFLPFACAGHKNIDVTSRPMVATDIAAIRIWIAEKCTP